jgi:hypothetical protein
MKKQPTQSQKPVRALPLDAVRGGNSGPSDANRIIER